MRIISYNVNGIRAAIKKGFIDWLKTNPADVICLQETKATEADIDVKALEELGFEHHWFSANKKGYSGVAIFSKIKPTAVKKEMAFQRVILKAGLLRCSLATLN